MVTKKIKLSSLDPKSQESIRRFSKLVYDKFYDEKHSEVEKHKTDVDVDDMKNDVQGFVSIYGLIISYGLDSYANVIMFKNPEEKELRDVECSEQLFYGYRNGYEMDKIGVDSDYDKLHYANYALINRASRIYDYTDLPTDKFIKVANELVMDHDADIEKFLLKIEKDSPEKKKKVTLAKFDEFGGSVTEEVEIDDDDLLGF